MPDLLFGLRDRVARGPYIGWGLSLAVLKFSIDTAVVWAFTGRVWSPLGYLVPSVVLRDQVVGPVPQAMNLLLAALALPFLWIGVSMSVRRAADAGINPWLGTLFLLPIVNYLTIAYLCAAPTNEDAPWHLDGAAAVDRGAPRVGRALPAVLVSVAIGLPMIGVSVYAFETYGGALFFATPFAMGAASAAVYNRPAPRALGRTVRIATVGVLLTGCAVLLFALEGVVCLAMAAPIAIATAALGATIGRAVVIGGRPSAHSPALVLLLPGLALGEARLSTPTPRDVSTAIEIDAPPERVWPNVIGFSEMREPPGWIFRLGVAYPLRARISGEGVGAVRRCEFSTGAFVEPITAWSPPRRLAFDVTSQPPSMTELSPYGAIRAPHLEGTMKSTGGEFDLEALPGGRTRLTGTTHYALAIYPEMYWVPYAEALLHSIHTRVLTHIKALSEHADR